MKIMIHSNKNIICLLFSLLACMACTNETQIDPQIEEDVPVTATITFESTDPVKIETRATDISEDNSIKSLAVFIFKSPNERVGEVHICSPDELSNKSVKIKTTSGTRYIYAIANYENSLFRLDTDVLKNISTITELKQLNTQLLQESISVLDGEYLMSGWVVPTGKEYDYKADQYCSINTDGIVNGKILLKHVMSSVKFKIACTNEQAIFIPTSWQIKQLPKITNVFEQEYDYSNEDAVFFKSKANVDFIKEEEYNTFSFLMMENRKKIKNTVTTIDTRDKREMTNGTAEQFVFANDHSTYLVLQGTYEGMTLATVNNDKSNKYVKAQVTYYIHLGVWNNGKITDYTNFDIFRNNRYTYTVNVAGVDDIIVEVEVDGNDSEIWGGDGDMYLSSQNVRTFDAHFETTVISFSKQQLLDLISEYGINPNRGEESLNMFKEKFVIQSSTPRNGFLSDETDNDWVEFRRNPKGVTTYVKYKDNTVQSYGNPLSADEFKEDLFNAASDLDYTNSDSIRYTCFINEYYYGDSKGNYDSTLGLPLKDFVNTRPRTMQICTYFKKNDMSPSTLNMALYTFSQRPICTIFDLDHLDKNVNGWGTEWIQEGENLKVDGSLAEKNEYYQGRKNTSDFFKENLQWDLYINYKNNNLTNERKYAQYACLARNRDLNGNGKIDDDELRWYLPSVKQYLGFVLGEDALPKDARLYNRSYGNNVSQYTYLCSSAYFSNSGSVNFYVLLAYEGASIDFNKQNDNYAYRCIRNLRNVTDPSDNYVVSSTATKEDGSTARSYSFERLNSKAKRNKVKGALTFGHNLFDEENRLSESFEVGEWVDNEDKTVNAFQASSSNPCQDIGGGGWRLPNQRELAIIVYNKVKDDGMDIAKNYFSCTKSSDDLYCGYDSKRTSMTLWGGSTTTIKIENYYEFIGFRCIKDK